MVQWVEAFAVKAWFIGYFSVTVIQHQDQGNLKKKEFILEYGSRGLEAVMAGTAQQQVEWQKQEAGSSHLELQA